jgi:hypothetical protein
VNTGSIPVSATNSSNTYGRQGITRYHAQRASVGSPAEVNFELVERPAERKERPGLLWPTSPRAGEEASRSSRCADRGRPPAAVGEQAPGTATQNSATVARRHPTHASPSQTQSPSARMIWNGKLNLRRLCEAGEIRLGLEAIGGDGPFLLTRQSQPGRGHPRRRVLLWQRLVAGCRKTSLVRRRCCDQVNDVERRRILQGAMSCTSGAMHSLWIPPLAHLWPSKSRPSFVNDVEGCFRSSAETIEPGRGHHLPDAPLAGLGTQA